MENMNYRKNILKELKFNNAKDSKITDSKGLKLGQSFNQRIYSQSTEGSTQSECSEGSDILFLNNVPQQSNNIAYNNTLHSDDLTALFIGNLHKNVTEKHIIDVFSCYPSFISAKLCVDSSNGQSLGHGYLNFGNKDDAEKAIDDLNYSSMFSKEIRLMPSMRNAQFRKQIGTNVYISNLPLVGNQMLTTRYFYDTFKRFGTILSCKLDRNKNIAFIYFTEEEAAKAAISKYHNTMFYGNNICCYIHIDKDTRRSNKWIQDKNKGSSTIEEKQLCMKKEPKYNKTETLTFQQGQQLQSTKYLTVLTKLPLGITKRDVFLMFNDTDIDDIRLQRIENSFITTAYIVTSQYMEISKILTSLSNFKISAHVTQFPQVYKITNTNNQFVYISNAFILCDAEFLYELCRQQKFKVKYIELNEYDSHTVSYSGIILAYDDLESRRIQTYLNGKILGGFQMTASLQPIHNYT